MKAKGSSDGNMGMLLQQKLPAWVMPPALPAAAGSSAEMLFLAEIVLCSGLAEAVLSSRNAPFLLPLPKAHLDHAGTDELRRGLLSPRGIWDIHSADSGAEVRPAPRAPLRSSCLLRAWKPQP